MLSDETIVYIKNTNSKRVRVVDDPSLRISIAGTCVIGHSDHYYVCNLKTREDYRNKGYATRILKYIIRAADKPIKLRVSKENKIALHLYTKLGFKVFDEGIETIGMVYTKNRSS
jgi:ribosomal protein S18 acetylase RimI-like enzyme